MKKALLYILVLVLLFSCCGCGKNKTNINNTTETKIKLSDSKITVGKKEISTNATSAVYAANDIVYYSDGKDFTYGEGTSDDAHTKSEADKHTVVHITQPGKYIINGKLSSGQIAIDLGKEARKDPTAVVTLVLDNVDINCSVAPAIIFYNVYECGNDNVDKATKNVDTSNAGANVIIADGSKNNITGSYVAKIYKPDSIVLTQDENAVESYEKLHKYDAAFYSKQTMNVGGEKLGNGILNINAENEGLDSELHLTINGGVINIVSGNDGINTNEDNVSVTTINDGTINILCDGSSGEGDGIDSNGWLVINGGTLTAQACSTSGDSGIDSDMGIYLNGGSVMASGNMLNSIAGGNQTYAIFSFADQQKGNNTYALKNNQNNSVKTFKSNNSFTYLLISGKELVSGDYTFWQNDTQLIAATSSVENLNKRPQISNNFTPKNNGEQQSPNYDIPEKPALERPSWLDDQQNKEPENPSKNSNKNPQKPTTNRPIFNDFGPTHSNVSSDELSEIFKITNGGNLFIGVTTLSSDTENNQ